MSATRGRATSRETAKRRSIACRRRPTMAWRTSQSCSTGRLAPSTAWQPAASRLASCSGVHPSHNTTMAGNSGSSRSTRTISSCDSPTDSPPTARTISSGGSAMSERPMTMRSDVPRGARSHSRWALRSAWTMMSGWARVARSWRRSARSSRTSRILGSIGPRSSEKLLSGLYLRFFRMSSLRYDGRLLSPAGTYRTRNLLRNGHLWRRTGRAIPFGTGVAAATVYRRSGGARPMEPQANPMKPSKPPPESACPAVRRKRRRRRRKPPTGELPKR